MRKIVFALKNYLFRRKAIEFYKEYQSHHSLTLEEVEKFQLEKINALYHYAKNNIPFYKEKYKSISIDRITSFNDFEKLPVLTKDEIRNNKDLFYESKNLLKFGRKVVTGGSTGVPLQVYHDIRYPVDTLGWRVLNWWGADISDNIAFIYRLLRKGFKAKIHEMLWYPTKRIFLDASYMTNASMSEFASKIFRVKPKILQGYVGAVYEFAKYCDNKQYSFPFIKAVWVTSAPLTEPNRLYMENIFKCPVYDQYGCSEVFWLAAECKQKEGLHVMSDARVVEVLSEDGTTQLQGDYGSIAVTDLENYLFPIIRYMNGDRGRYLKSKCTCGINFPMLDKIKGRVSDILRLPDGGIISGEYLTTIFDDAPLHVKSFQVYQYKDYSVDLICVLGDENDSLKVCEQKCIELSAMSNETLDVKLKIVDSISHDQGKIRFIVSEIRG